MPYRLMQIKKRYGLTCWQIAQLEEFSGVKLSALSGMYNYIKKKGVNE